MPRLGRLHIVGGYYHVMGRGLERRDIFKTKEDKEDLLSRLAAGLEATHSQCMAWAILSNHYHLLIRVSAIALSQLMSQVLSGYATQYNRRHRRVGYVFQNRYKSILCDEEAYFLEMVRYIHINPLKAKIVKTLRELDQYRWTGHAGIMGNHFQEWQARDEVLSRFGRRIDAARRHYRAFINDGLHSPADIDYEGGGLIRSYGGWQNIQEKRAHHEARIGDERILGESKFVEQALKEDELQIEAQTRLKRSGWTLEKLIKNVCQSYGVPPKYITHKGRVNALSTVKALICYWGTTKLGVSSTEISIRLNISQPAVSQASKRGLRHCLANEIELEVR